MAGWVWVMCIDYLLGGWVLFECKCCGFLLGFHVDLLGVLVCLDRVECFDVSVEEG